MTVVRTSVAAVADQTELPDSFLSCYEIVAPESLTWPVRLYKVIRTDGARQSHSNRGEMKQTIWDLRRQYSSLCREYGFVVDVDTETVAVPLGWELPSGALVGNYHVTLAQTFTTDPTQAAHRGLIAGILRDAMKKHFKDNLSDALGHVWQDYDRFCQVPSPLEDTEFHFCRRLWVTAKVLRGNRWVLQVLISTVTGG